MRPFSVPPPVRKKARGRLSANRLLRESLEPPEAPVTGLTSFAPGAYVIDVGQPSRTVTDSLRPYGMVYDLEQGQHIPVDWAINPNKSVYGADFAVVGKSYFGGSFFIEMPFAAAAQGTITKWQAQGVVANAIGTAFTAPI